MTELDQGARLARTVGELGSAHVLVVGDLILDRYTWGNAERISQEAPVVVLRTDRRESRLGGAANVACMLRGLDGHVSCAGLVGADESGRELRAKLAEEQIDDRLVLDDGHRVTTVKERFIGRASGRHPNQILRVDTEDRMAMGRQLELELIRAIQHSITGYQCVLISDYGKGVCSPALVRAVIQAGRETGVPVLVDPARTTDYTAYRGATVLKPNRVETETATGTRIQSADDALLAGRRLCEQLDLSAVVITLDRDGMAWVPRSGEASVFATKPRAVYDITGAGDIVLAMLGLCWADNIAPTDAVQLSNVAGALEVGRTGVAKVTRDEIRAELLSGHRHGSHKILETGELSAFGRRQRELGKRIVFTNGCFDLLHVGHVTYLAEAAAAGDVLVIGMNGDDSVRRLKGPERPVICQSDRAAMLAALACVDAVVVFDDATPHQMLAALQPDILIKGGTYSPSEVVGREVVEAYGGQVQVTGLVDGISTTRIVQSLRRPTSLPSEEPSTPEPTEFPTLREAG